MLTGFDISHHNKYPDGRPCDFIIVKLTEGKSMIDVAGRSHIAKAMDAGLKVGAYHYARPEYNTPTQEVQNFLARCEEYGIIGKAILALDYEGEALKCGPGWAREWCDVLYYKTGVKPVIYIQRSEIYKYTALIEGDYGLWVPKWSNTKPTKQDIYPWPFWAIWQYNGSGYDKDVFNGNEEQWDLYAKGTRR